MIKVLIIDDEKDLVESIEYNLKKEGFLTFRAYDGQAGLKSTREKLPDLIILDLMLPEISGMDLCKILKKEEKTSEIPIIMLTAKTSQVDKIVGLEIGADDYLTKPFDMRELIARIKAILKRSGLKEQTSTTSLKFPDLEVDTARHEVKVLGKIVELTAKEFTLLRYLMENKERVCTRETLLDTVWGIEVAIETRTVDAHIKNLREKLGKAKKHILTLRGVGYKFHA
ncbi:MAG: two-component system OmpR family alkaline phosphatase synthesis response regulator PhoP [Candidatus Saganbacteria bacterium]|uniref:Two-component system OmpR family alkaline phosphatase synthesis response regulator PhoP n=1 Tax=Candidatus Saganbacteria bacterium TaxID=2575572 RepID=A0A833L0J9_UNCSA|nr:MAG: two-component system OmpR family alkaline phosphatase synthesis response regulator PhoP [Candidatus Saganbacteria bacterium]